MLVVAGADQKVYGTGLVYQTPRWSDGCGPGMPSARGGHGMGEAAAGRLVTQAARSGGHDAGFS